MESDAPPPTSPTTSPSGNTQLQVTLMGAHGTRNGQPQARPLKVNPDGALAVEMEVSTGYLTGRFQVQEGDQIVFAEGRVVAIFRSTGLPALPVPDPGAPF